MADQVATAADYLAGYLRAHPKAEDSLAGIMQWWLQRDAPLFSADDVQQALMRLQDRGVAQSRMRNRETVWSAADRAPG